MTSIPFNKAHMTCGELRNIEEAYAKGALSGNGYFSKSCENWLETYLQAKRALLTHSCTGALEMAGLLLDLKPGDEVIMPSYTFVSTANAVVLRGAKPVFVDIRPDTLNMDETQIESLITPRTRSIWVVHYAGVSCEMDVITDIAQRHKLSIVEDAAQGILSTYKGRALGTMGDIGTLSFHETKNVTCGEGGALLINRPDLIDRAEIIHEKGTNRRAFQRGKVDKYTWHDKGSSFLLGELAAAFLKSQLDHAANITAKRLALWEQYHAALKGLEIAGHLSRPTVPDTCHHNAHMYYIILRPDMPRETFLSQLNAKGISAVFHYVPLHSSPAGQKISKTNRPLPHTEDLSARLVRLPLWTDLPPSAIEQITGTITDILTA